MPHHTIYYCHACGSRTVPHNDLCAFCDSEFIEIYDSVEYYRSVHFGISEILRSIAIGQVDVNELDWLISDISDRIRRLTRDLLNIRSSRGGRVRNGERHAWRRYGAERDSTEDVVYRYGTDHYWSDQNTNGGEPVERVYDRNGFRTADDINNYALDHELDDIIDEIFVSAKVATSPVSSKYIKALQISRAKDRGKCMICLSTYKKEECGVELNCSHFFHKRCCIKWMRMQNTCPICRDEIEK